MTPVKHKINAQVPCRLRSVGSWLKKTVVDTRTIEVDGKTYKKLQKEVKNRSYNIGEMMLYDEIFDEWEDPPCFGL